MSSDLIPAGALVVGGLLTIAGGVVREQYTSRRDREARAADRELAHEARAAERHVARVAFQRDTLLELQDAVLRLMRNTALLHIHHRKVYWENRTYAREKDPPELSDENREANAAVNRLRQRVLDDSLRQDVRAVQELCTQITMPTQLTGESDDEAARRANEQNVRLAHEYTDLENHLGEVLRALL